MYHLSITPHHVWNMFSFFFFCTCLVPFNFPIAFFALGLFPVLICFLVFCTFEPLVFFNQLIISDSFLVCVFLEACVFVLSIFASNPAPRFDPFLPSCYSGSFSTFLSSALPTNRVEVLKATLPSLWSKTLHFKRSFICNPVTLRNLSFGHCYKNIRKSYLHTIQRK